MLSNITLRTGTHETGSYWHGEERRKALSEMWVVGGEIDEVTISLRVFGDELDPGEVTAQLGRAPTKSWMKGYQDTSGKRPIVRNTGAWLLDGECPRSCTLESQIDELLSSMNADLSVWQSLTSRYHVDLFCGLFLAELNRGTRLSPKILEKLADRSIPLSLDVYCNE